jgi:secondary thiamine-phosphate synthase enzyme
MIYKLAIKTTAAVEFLDITDKVREIVKDSKIESGFCLVYVPHTTAGIMINEHADPDVVGDIKNQLDKMVPLRSNYKHGEGNSAAHIKAALIGTSATMIIQYGDLALGAWQGIFFGEFDGPRNRSVMVKVIAD